MSNAEFSKATLLKKLRKEVWGDETALKGSRTWVDSKTEISHTVDYLDFGEHLAAIQVVAPTVFDAQFLVREEYRQAVKTFETDDEYNRGACIIGQPGIGKSCFVAYAVIERLRKKQPVAVQIQPENSEQSYALFLEDDVRFYSGYDDEPLRPYEGIWTFSDSNEGVTIPVTAFRDTPNVRVFQTTSPKVERWEKWSRQKRIKRYIMNVWSDEEIAALATLLRLDADHMKDLASKWGPVPRTLLQNFRDDQEILVTVRSAAFKAIPNCMNILRSIGTLDIPIDAGPSSIFFIKPKESQGLISRVLHSVYVPTATIRGILAEAVCSAVEGQRQDFFNAMMAFPDTHDTAGLIFEVWVHSYLASGKTIQCNWFGDGKKKLPPTLCLTSRKTISTKDELRHTTPPFYWRAPPHFPGIDGALFVEQDVYAIQITIDYSHKDPEDGLKSLRRRVGQEKEKELRWSVLFIGSTPEQSKAVSQECFDKARKDASNDGAKRKWWKKGTQDIRIGWCATSPLDSGISVLKALTYDTLESEDEGSSEDDE